MKERGTPMNEAEMAVILDYLAAYYSRDPAPPAGPDTLASKDGDSAKKILDRNACSGCHAPDTRIVGPSFREVSLKYKDDPEAKTRLMSKIRQGGQGVWGQVPMPPNPAISEEDLRSVVGWVLQLPESESVATTLDRIFRSAYDYNTTKKGQLMPVKTVGEAIEVIPAKAFKEADLWVKSKTPVLVLKTDNEIPKE